jgi:hypothetical protein
MKKPTAASGNEANGRKIKDCQCVHDTRNCSSAANCPPSFERLDVIVGRVLARLLTENREEWFPDG